MIRLGTFTPSVLLRVARLSGRLPVAVEEVPVASSPAQFDALASGDLDAGLTSPDNVLGRGGTVSVAIDRGMGLALYARPSVVGPGGISGADAAPGYHFRFAVDVPDSGFAYAMYAILGRRPDVVALGSTPKRLRALLAGECDATMLNAGNELLAEEAGFVRVGAAPQPYLGTVLIGDLALADALLSTSAAICAGSLDDLVIASAQEALGLPPQLARRYLERMVSPTEGLVPSGVVDPAALATIAALRARFGP